MKKKIVCALAALALLFALSIPACAEGAAFMFDVRGNMTYPEEAELAAQKIFDKYGVAVCYASAQSLNGMTLAELAESAYTEKAPAVSGILLLDVAEAPDYYIYQSEQNGRYFTEEQLGELMDVYAESGSYFDSVMAYLAAAEDMLSAAFPAAAATAPARVIPAERQLARVTDAASVLSAEELESLNARADEVSEAYGCDVAVAFVSGTEGMSAQSYADDFYDYNGFGYGSDDSGILLLVDVTGRSYAVTTYGYGIYAFTDAGQSYMDEKYVPLLSAGDWAGAAESFVSVSAELLQTARNGSPYDVGSMPRGSFSPVWIIADIIAGLLFAFIPVNVMKRRLKTVETQRDAGNYVIAEDVSAVRRGDRFLYRTVNRTPHPRHEDGGHGGGSRMHVSSSGRSHGGHSGRF